MQTIMLKWLRIDTNSVLIQHFNRLFFFEREVRMKRRIIAVLLILCLCVGLVPTVFASSTLESSVNIDQLLNHGLAIIRKIEAGDRYDSVINTSSCVGMGIGGWIGPAACQLLKWIVKADPAYCRQVLGDALYYEVVSEPITDSTSMMPYWSSSSWRYRKFSASEITAAKALLSSGIGRQQQDALLRYYIYSEAKNGFNKYGVRTEAALLYYCAAQHHGGEGSAKNMVNEVKAVLGIPSSGLIPSLDAFHSALLAKAAASPSSSCASHKSYQTKVYNYIVNNLGLPTGPAVGSGSPVPFTDMPDPSHWAYDAIVWAYTSNPQITSGTSATTFSPDATLTRAEAMTFLWAAAFKPQPASGSNPFADVPDDAFYHDAVLWAVQNGITGGTSATTFSPMDTVSVGQMLTFLWAFAGRPQSYFTQNPFSDVGNTVYYHDPVLWAHYGGILVGNEGSGGKLYPDQGCSRAYVVTYLYNYFVLGAH